MDLAHTRAQKNDKGFLAFGAALAGLGRGVLAFGVMEAGENSYKKCTVDS